VQGSGSDESSGDDLFVPRSKSKAEQSKDDAEYAEFAKDRLAEKDPTQTLASLLKDEDMDDDERFLRSYVLGNEWREQEKGVPTYGDVVGEGFSDEETAVIEAEDFEDKYNFRFEQKGSDQIVGHAREVPGSLRRPDERRKEARERKKERVKTVHEQKKEELKRLKEQKKSEIVDRLKKIAELSGVKTVDPEAVDLDDEFDPAEHDRKMAALYNDDYYEQGEMEHPFADGADADFLECAPPCSPPRAL
jgi:protein KRI1